MGTSLSSATCQLCDIGRRTSFLFASVVCKRKGNTLLPNFTPLPMVQPVSFQTLLFKNANLEEIEIKMEIKRWKDWNRVDRCNQWDHRVLEGGVEQG